MTRKKPLFQRPPRGVGPPPAVAEQVLVGSALAIAATMGEAVVCAVRSDPQGFDGAALLLAVLHLGALQLPLGVALGVVLGLALLLVRRTPWTRAVRLRLSSRRKLFAANPEAFADATLAVVSGGIFFVVTQKTALHFATRYHDENMAAWAMAGATVGVLVVSFLCGLLAAWFARKIAPLLGRFASMGTILSLALVAIAVTIGEVFRRSPRLLHVFDPVVLFWPAGLLLVWSLLAILVRWRLTTGKVSRQRIRQMALMISLFTVTATCISGVNYGRSSRVRTVLEQRSVSGLRLLRLFASFTDRDRDGHSFAFGGDDCDDGDPRVHPGALDLPGDGIDADCFDGDGSRDVADYSDGGYADPPEGLLRPNFLLITVDALRPDHLGCNGYIRPTSPNIDRFCEESVRFNQAFAQSSRSIRSLPAMFTGFNASQIAFGDEYLFPALRDGENETVAEVLSDNGYATAVTMGTDYFTRTGDFFQGFADVNQINIYKPPRARPVTDGLRQLRRLASGDQPWFLWVHLFNVHEPYLWDSSRSAFGDESMGKYDTEITHADKEVQRLLDELDRLGVEGKTVVVLASDHGEAFGEHNNRGHSFTLYDEELRSLLLMRVPGVESRTIEQGVGLMDVTPTLLNLARIDVPRRMPARSLVPLITGSGTLPEDRLLISELMPDGLYPFDVKSVRRGQMKLIWRVREGSVELYDLSTDPAEQRDIADQDPETADELLGLLRAWMAQTNRPENRHWDVVEHNRLRRAPARMTKRLNARFPGRFTVLGFDMPKKRFRPGERIPITFYYRVEGETTANLFFYVDIEGPPGYPVPPHFHAHHYPLNGRYRTYEWRTGEIIRDAVEMVIPENIRRPVTLRITLSVLENRRRTPFTPDAADSRILELAEVEIR